MPRLGRAIYRGWFLVCVEAWEGMNVYYAIGPGPDPPCKWGLRKTFDEAVEAGSKVVLEEAGNEQSSRGRS